MKMIFSCLCQLTLVSVRYLYKFSFPLDREEQEGCLLNVPFLPFCIKLKNGWLFCPTMPALLVQLHFQPNPWRIFFLQSPTAGSSSPEVPNILFIILLHIPLSNFASSTVYTHLFLPIIFWKEELSGRCALQQRAKAGTPGHCERSIACNIIKEKICSE